MWYSRGGKTGVTRMSQFAFVTEYSLPNRAGKAASGVRSCLTNCEHPTSGAALPRIRGQS